MQQITLFNTPVLTPCIRALSRFTLKMLGWKITGEIPRDLKKCVVVGAPHTTNWDLPFGLMFGFSLDLSFHWVGKHTIFSFPFGGVMKWLGGVPINRKTSKNMVTATVEKFTELDELHLVIAPEGTRSKVKEWKSGFYHIAYNAQVPIVLAYIDYNNRLGGVGKIFYPTGDYEKDLKEILAFYAPYQPGAS